MWTVADLVVALEAQGERAVLITMTEDRAVAHGGVALADQIRRLAQGLCGAGLQPGDRLIIVGPNSAAWVIVRLAAALVGAVPVACDDQSSAAEIAAIVRDSGCRLAFSSAAHASTVRGAAPADCRVYRLDGGAGEVDAWSGLLAQAPLTEPPQPAGDGPAMIVYTSGTTGAPKNFVLSHGNIAANLEALLAAKVISGADRILLPLPLHHVFPLLVGMMTTLASGATLVFPAAATGPQIATALRLARVSVIVGVPRLYTALLGGIEARVAARGAVARGAFRVMLAVSTALRKRLGWRVGRRLFAGLHRQAGPVLRLMVSGGAKLDAPIIWKLEGLGWEVLSGYGLAETASLFTGNLPGARRVGSEGRPFGDGRIRIGDPDGAGIGEILLFGPNVFAGYRDNPEANRTAFTPDGWFRTGDLGTLDQDGFLTVTGRSKEQLVLGGGKKVMPEELERHYAANPLIQEIAVLEREGKLVALVLPDLAAMRAAGMTRPEEAMRVALATGGQALPSYQRVAGFALAREPLPRTRLGKYQRFLLPRLYDAIGRGEARGKPRELSAADRALVSTSPAREVWDLLMARYGAKGLSLESDLALDLGLDSLEWMTVALEIEARVQRRLSEAMIAEIATVRDLLAAIAAAPQTTPREDGTSLAGATLADVTQGLKPNGAALTLLAAIFYGFNWLVMRLMFRLRTSGSEYIPADGPFVVIANHVSDLDPLVLSAALSRRSLRRLYWAGEVTRLFAHGWQRMLARALHIFPADEHSPAATLGNAKTVLRQGAALGWFPESWRSPTGELQRFLPGIGLVLADVPVMVVPAYIQGTFEAMPRSRSWPRLHPVRVAFGPPIAAEVIAALAAEPDAPQRVVTLLHDRVAALAHAAAQGAISKRPEMN